MEKEETKKIINELLSNDVADDLATFKTGAIGDDGELIHTNVDYHNFLSGFYCARNILLNNSEKFLEVNTSENQLTTNKIKENIKKFR